MPISFERNMYQQQPPYRAMIQQQNMETREMSVPIKDIAQILEPLIRRVVRQELARVVKKASGVFVLTPEMPIYQDMDGLKKKRLHNEIEFFSSNEVWGE